MTHWTDYPPDQGICTNVAVGVNYRLFLWIEQTRGKKSRSQFIRDILTEVMEDA